MDMEKTERRASDSCEDWLVPFISIIAEKLLGPFRVQHRRTERSSQTTQTQVSSYTFDGTDVDYPHPMPTEQPYQLRRSTRLQKIHGRNIRQDNLYVEETGASWIEGLLRMPQIEPDISSISRMDDLPAESTDQLSPTTFPYNSSLRNCWFKQVINDNRCCLSRPIRRKTRFRNMVDVINVDSPSVDPTQCLTERLSAVNQSDGDKFYFHGTLACHVTSILENGIMLQYGKRKQDFSNGRGFYVTENPKQAVKWAQKLARRSKAPARCGVVVFRISRSMQTEEGVLSLYGNDNKTKKLWRQIVMHYRRGEHNEQLKVALASMKAIEGPVYKCSVKQSTQLCIQDDDYASRFGTLENIPCVLCF